MKLRQREWVCQGRRLVAAAALCASALNAQAAFSVNLTFSGMTPTEESYFAAAKSFWESAITGYASGPLTGITINASKVAIDGVDGFLGRAGPIGSSVFGGYSYSTLGVMEFDSADMPSLINDGTFGDLVLHEMAHVIGFGTLWEANGLYDEVNQPGRYTGITALATYKAEFNKPTATFIPVELTGGPGTAHAHWAEGPNGFGPTGTRDSLGRDLQFELMTGWLDTPAYVSQTTIASFQDLGYTVVLSAVPEAGTVALWLLGLPLLAGLTRQRRA